MNDKIIIAALNAFHADDAKVWSQDEMEAMQAAAKVIIQASVTVCYDAAYDLAYARGLRAGAIEHEKGSETSHVAERMMTEAKAVIRDL